MIHTKKSRGLCYLFLLLGMALSVAWYSQRDVFWNTYLVNDDVCQHIWWMRSFVDSGLFQGDLLKDYAKSLQNFGILGLYYSTFRFIDPLELARFLPFFLLPLSCCFVFLLARRLAGENFSAFLVACAFAVTPLYIQHMTGGQAHSFAYPLLTGFLYFYFSRRWFCAAFVLFLAVLFFPIIFVLGATIWLLGFLFNDRFLSRISLMRNSGLLKESSGSRDFFVYEGVFVRWFLVVLLTGCSVLMLRYSVFNAPKMGPLLKREQIARMPELGAQGRWVVWPVEPVWRIVPHSMQEGLGLFKGLRRSFLPEQVKVRLLDGHVFFFVLAGLSLVWWRKKLRTGGGIFFPVVIASLFWYVLAGVRLFQFYAPDRYVAYTFSIVMLFLVMIPVGKISSGFGNSWRARLIRCGLIVLVLGQVFLTRTAGLKDYSALRGLYQYLSALPAESRIVSRPDISDGIPLFSRRSVYLSLELSVPLYSSYWTEISRRTRRFFRAYYAEDINEVIAFMREEYLTHLIVDRVDFSPKHISAGIYFEPFSQEICELSKGKVFALANISNVVCDFRAGTVCVVSLSGLLNYGQGHYEDHSGGES